MFDHPDPGASPYRSRVVNLRASHRWWCEIGVRGTENTIGLQLRNDDAVHFSMGLWLENEIRWDDQFRTTLRLRGDLNRFVSDTDFAQDNGFIEADPPRIGGSAELANYYQPCPWLSLDCRLGLSTASLRRSELGYETQDNVIDLTASAGIMASVDGFTAGLRMNYFAGRSSKSSLLDQTATQVDLQLGYQVSERSTISLGLLNLVGTDGSGLDYLYTTRRSGELPVGEGDIDLGEVEPRTLQILFQIRF